MAPEKPVFKEARAGKPRPPLPWVLAFSVGSSLLLWALKRTTKPSGLKAAMMPLLVVSDSSTNYECSVSQEMNRRLSVVATSIYCSEELC